MRTIKVWSTWLTSDCATARQTPCSLRHGNGKNTSQIQRACGSPAALRRSYECFCAPLAQGLGKERHDGTSMQERPPTRSSNRPCSFRLRLRRQESLKVVHDRLQSALRERLQEKKMTSKMHRLEQAGHTGLLARSCAVFALARKISDGGASPPAGAPPEVIYWSTANEGGWAARTANACSAA